MSDSALEPRHVEPVAGGHLRASDGDRDQVATVLSTAFAEGRLTRDEYDERLDALLQAKTFDDLVGLTRDLVVASAPPAPVPAPGEHEYRVDTTSSRDEPERLVAIFGGAERKGTWRIRRRTEAYALFGGVDLDLRKATFESPVVEVSGFWCFGGCDIKVPAGIEVRNEVVGIFGGADVKDVGDAHPGAPVLVVKGVALFGGVSVRGPKPGRRSVASAITGGRLGKHGCGGHNRH